MTALRFTEDHEWISVDGTAATVGITDYAQDKLGDIVFVELPGCGFELRGASTLPERIGALYVIGNTAIADYIEVAMVGGDVRMVNVPEEADLRVTLHGERFDQRVLSVDPDTGKEREFELTYTLELSAVDRAGKTVLSRQNLVLTRDYIFDRDAVIAAPTASVAVATTIPAVRNSRLDIPLPSTSQANHPER